MELGQLPSRFPWLPSRDIQLRIRQLEASGKLCGIMDNARGKYVYISRKELDGVAAFIRSKGRVR